MIFKISMKMIKKYQIENINQMIIIMRSLKKIIVNIIHKFKTRTTKLIDI